MAHKKKGCSRLKEADLNKNRGMEGKAIKTGTEEEKYRVCSRKTKY